MLELQQDLWRHALEIETHRQIEYRWSGRPGEVGPGLARVTLETVPPMTADESGLIRGGFTFSAADHAAMPAVNHPLEARGGK